MIVTWPAPVAEMLADDARRTPMELVPVAQDVPLNVIKPLLVVTFEFSAKMPFALSVPFAAVPEIVTLPEPVAKMLADDLRRTPMEPATVPQEVPLTVSEPELAVTLAPSTRIPCASFFPFPAVPVIVTLPNPVAEMLADAVK